jgi:hypothetical protein
VWSEKRARGIGRIDAEPEVIVRTVVIGRS